jgi:hypothetical protein
MSGRVLTPEDSGYEEARLVHNGTVDQRPSIIAECLDTAVCARVRTARSALDHRHSKYIVVHETCSDGATKVLFDIFNSDLPAQR